MFNFVCSKVPLGDVCSVALNIVLIFFVCFVLYKLFVPKPKKDKR